MVFCILTYPNSPSKLVSTTAVGLTNSSFLLHQTHISKLFNRVVINSKKALTCSGVVYVPSCIIVIIQCVKCAPSSSSPTVPCLRHMFPVIFKFQFFYMSSTQRNFNETPITQSLNHDMTLPFHCDNNCNVVTSV